jgi:glycosyltransferase involved in cell wall biosynthesis
MLETDGPGGAEQIVYQLAEELRRRGHTVYPVGPDWTRGWLSAKYRAGGFDYRTFSLRRPLDLHCLRGMVRLLTALKLDAVHSHEFTMAVYGAAAARLAGRRHVITFHGNQTMTSVWRRRVAVRWALRASCATVAVSEATRQDLAASLGIPPSRIHLIRNGIPLRPGRPDQIRTELGLTPGELLIVAVGNLTPRKAHWVLLEALVELRREGFDPPWHVAVAGRGPERDRLEAFAREHRIDHRVHLLGVRDDVPDLLAAAQVFVMPSLWEGLPLAVLEAMHAGLPIVASEASGIPEAITPDVEGVLVAPGDPAAFARALRRVMGDEGLRARLGAAAQRRARAAFTIAGMADQYEVLYRGAPVAPRG